MDLDQGFKKLIARHEGEKFIIAETDGYLCDGKVIMRWWVYGFKGAKCTHDYQQDTLEQAKSCALSEFGVPIDSWVEVTSDSELPDWLRSS